MGRTDVETHHTLRIIGFVLAIAEALYVSLSNARYDLAQF